MSTAKNAAAVARIQVSGVPRRFGRAVGAGGTSAAVVPHVNITLPLAVTGFGEKAQVGKSTAPDGAEVNVDESVIAPAVSVTASVEVPEPP
jgi:putative protein kinase ArgK-like GTPase of G3E family